MFPSSTPGLSRLKKTQKLSLAGVAAIGAAALSLSVVPGPSPAEAEVREVAAAPVAAWSGYRNAELQAGIAGQKSAFEVRAAATAKAEAEANASIKAKAEAVAKAKAATEAKAKAAAKAKAEAAAEERAAAEAAASRTAARTPVYADNLDGWIREALSIMKKHDIPGSYEGIHRNIMRESSGNPNAINDWDINARNGVPSIGLLQVIKPTFDAYHIPGTKKSQWDPVANIVAACNYAADRYGSMDNVDSAY
ncbi:transglycosylase SLT domain-containing protein [Streptomyces somaliensis DSM 40738]|uniref:Transglycosylase SLT domain-containing protein n=1 Tax=Streptomyces somaliensis (strain ATCC 33201 / DSM 40738 / JCM 12659 / KCTC 9044 / NCTC 11332 / NRRL B-12077 / IP 733) TaxID=1134445 RepID=A0AA44DFN9_STRE0|nr:transglycosylase SLT domain-containing protein [Streptomyces somaliensis]MCQ0022184.1 transglycosylase SLT domain-containing protein [Streptomyces somaliensis DSM 40738]NKY15644.1 transglycosylase SLT domain-containing protein [Streptomyces somaliensis DSM 40738]